jgi:hypothetical protein
MRHNFRYGAVAALLSCACTAHAQSTITVPAGGNLQAAIDRAVPGDTILLAPGSSYVGNFYLRKKTGTAKITIATSGQQTKYSVPARVKPSDAVTFAKLIAPNDRPVLRADLGAHDYRIAGVEIKAQPNIYNLGLVRFGDGTEKTSADLPYNLELDRAYVHGDPNVGSKRGVAMNGKNLTVSNCYISDFKSVDQDTQAISGYGGPGPLMVYNNYLEAAAENILFGGTAPGIPDTIPSDISIIGNHLYKPLAWRTFLTPSGKRWLVKNILEIKSGRRIRIEGNVLENVWEHGQVGYAVLLKAQKDVASALADTSDVVFTKNIVRHAAAGVNIAGRIAPTQWTTKRITISNNLFEDIGGTWGSKTRLFTIIFGAHNVTIENNTATPTVKVGAYVSSDGEPSSGFVFRSNIVPYGDTGMKGSGAASGLKTAQAFFPGSVISNNVVYNTPSSAYGFTPLDTFLKSYLNVGWVDPLKTWLLSTISTFNSKGANGADPGYDHDAVKAATLTAVSGK